jgi:hypothetical protein
MFEFYALIIFTVSVVGILFILLKKIPALAQLPQKGSYGFKKSEFIITIEKKVKDFHFDFFHKQVYLHKTLSFIKIWTLKLERIIDVRLHGIRKKAQELDKNISKKK